jgi:hypothetical protein
VSLVATRTESPAHGLSAATWLAAAILPGVRCLTKVPVSRSHGRVGGTGLIEGRFCQCE